MLQPARTRYDVAVYTQRRTLVASCYTVSRAASEAALVAGLGRFVPDDSLTIAAWEELLESACFHAAAGGKHRVLACAETDSAAAEALRRAGFTTVTREVVYARSPDAAVGASPEFPRMRRGDLWEAWKLYRSTEPPAIQHAEGLTPKAWARGRNDASQGEERILHRDGAAVIHMKLAIAAPAAALRVRYRPEHRSELAAALDYALRRSAQKKSQVLYCAAAEHQSELHGLLQDRGFQPAFEQTKQALYTSVLSYAAEAYTSPALRISRVRREIAPRTLTVDQHAGAALCYNGYVKRTGE